MKYLLLIVILVPFIAPAHPGVGIVKDSKGNIYYTDLHQVWRISNNTQTVVVPGVHTHELYIDAKDDLYGENLIYDEKSNKFYHYSWVYHANGQIDTAIGMKQAYLTSDFSLARDKYGNEYYTKQFLIAPDTNHIYKKTPDGQETIFASGQLKGVQWLHPQQDETLLFVSDNAIYRADSLGNIRLVKAGVGNKKPSYQFSKNNITIWGVWKDEAQNIYVAVFSDQAVKKIDSNGMMTEVYKSKGSWTPLHGVVDKDNKLWILEGSDKNDVRVILADSSITEVKKTNSKLLFYFVPAGLGLAILFLGWKYRTYNPGKLRNTQN